MQKLGSCTCTIRLSLTGSNILADTGSMKHKQDLSTSLHLDSIVAAKLIIIKVNILNAQHITTKINMLIILVSLNNHCLLRVYNKHLDLNLKLSC